MEIEKYIKKNIMPHGIKQKCGLKNEASGGEYPSRGFRNSDQPTN
ncbi:MAG: hypothetical protein ACI9EM_000268 [Candidatus Thalassarchaeaceae archaeon]|jgi:hypothetical protein|tara:strand:+ start:1148 stop:1282 length:135 start_codon:yes stop_codon:yes gene_type:complete